MALELLENRGRTLGLLGALAFHLLALVLALLLSGGPQVQQTRAPDLVSVDLSEPPPPPPPPPPRARPARHQQAEPAAAPPSRGVTKAPSPLPPPIALASPTPAQAAPDTGSAQASGRGTAPGRGAGQGGRGEGTGAGLAGSGGGAASVTPPVHIAGALTSGDYRAAHLPRGTAATVRVGFRVRPDGSVDQCVVIAPSGFPSIDEATCRLIEQRFRFTPALDGAGNPIAWNVRTDYTWAPR